ncbi:radical SAM protein, partial [Myxococcota bacterium]|nr:radical SAM protein [Myxococcota bacterium]
MGQSGLPEFATPIFNEGDIFSFAEAHAVPLSMHWDVTWRCDHACTHCYLTDRRQPDLTLEEGKRLLAEMARAGVMMLLFSGGDPFLRRDFMALLAEARRLRFDIRINTHGNAITEAIADELARLKVGQISLSVYSDRPQAHEAITRVPGSLAKTLDAARRLIVRGIKVVLKTPMLAENLDHYEGVGRLAAELGAYWELDAHVLPDDAGGFELCHSGGAWSDRVGAVMQTLEARQGEFTPHMTLPPMPRGRRVCTAGNSSGYITPDGQVTPCINWRQTLGSTRERPFDALWADPAPFAHIRGLRRAHFIERCDAHRQAQGVEGACPHEDQCSFCPGLAYAEVGEAAGHSDYVCERTHIIMEAIEEMKAGAVTGDWAARRAAQRASGRAAGVS